MSNPVWKQNLITGYQNFRKGAYRAQKDMFEEVGKHGQHPDVMVIACSDSRANPSTIFNAYPGEIFVIRNVANIVPPYDPSTGFHGTSSAIEFAVKALKVKAIMVMGHESCGGVQAFLDDVGDTPKGEEEEHSFLTSWIHILDTAHARLAEAGDGSEASQRQMEYAGVRQSLANLMSFPFIEKAVAAGELSLLGAYFSIIAGKLMFADKDGIFKDVASEA